MHIGVIRSAASVAALLVLLHGCQQTALAGMTRHVIRDYGVDPTRVWVAGLSAGGAMAVEADLEPGISLTVRDAGGHAYTRSIYRANGQTVIELWIVHGLGHAWSGGSSDAAYADVNEPSAAEHMLRFFVEATASGTVNRS